MSHPERPYRPAPQRAPWLPAARTGTRTSHTTHTVRTVSTPGSTTPGMSCSSCSRRRGAVTLAYGRGRRGPVLLPPAAAWTGSDALACWGAGAAG
ncbi:hypothetical protein ACFTZI_37155 [Streptomyces decoyicus]|uniref:hypothetical protein n=1 Tax=Streptomyces decoyicus TaxID=249567 RepID=UPI00362B76A7